MAIVIEEEKSRSSGAWVALLMWIVFFVALAAGFYYVFVKKPDLILIPTPTEFRNTEQLSKLELKPGDVLENPEFQNLKNWIKPVDIGTTGRANPFLGF